MQPLPILWLGMMLGTMLLPAADPNELPATKAFRVTMGIDLKKGLHAGKTLLTAEYWPASNLVQSLALKPVWAVAFSPDSMGLSAGIRRDHDIGGWTVTPYFGPVLYASPWNRPKAQALLQFRTGLDFSFPLTDTLQIGAGFYHISNTGLVAHDYNANLSVVHFSVRFLF